MRCEIKQADCEKYLQTNPEEQFDLTFLDPPFNQGKEYRNHNDNLEPSHYWEWMQRICHLVYEHTAQGGSIYFMQREKNAHLVIDALLASHWTFQNMIVWKKKTSAVPIEKAFGKHYQIIVFATKGERPRVFNKLRIDPPLLRTESHHRPTGMYVTDVWDDIRELTSGYFAGAEPLRSKNGDRAHKQQAPIQLLARIILSSSNVNDTVFDPFAGTGTTLVVARQLRRDSLGVELDPENVALIKSRLAQKRKSDDLTRVRSSYSFTDNLDKIWPQEQNETRFPQQPLLV